MALNLIDKVKSLKNLNPELPALQFAKKAAKYLSLGVSAAFLAALALAIKLGAAAIKGFTIGAITGGSGGAALGFYVGLQVGIALAPYTFGLSLIVAPLAGAFIGGVGGATIFGLAGALIGFGLASGNVTAVSMGVGAGVGGAIGAYIGWGIGTATWLGIVGVCAAVTGGACGLLAAFTPAAGLAGSVVFGFIGAGIGAGIGYVISEYIIDPVRSSIQGISMSGSASGFWSWLGDGLAGFGHWVTGLGSSLVNGAISLGGSFLNGLVDVGSSLIGHLTGATGAIAGQIAAVAVGTTVASAATLAILNAGILTPGKFATTQTDDSQNIIPPPQSAYLTVTKTATPSTLQNSDLPRTINFEVTLTAKSVKLINVTCEDLATLVKSSGSTIPLTVTPTPSCPSTIDANAQIKFNFTTQAQNTPDFQNASIINVFNVYYDIGELALGSCGTGSGFSNLLPDPIPPSLGAIPPSDFLRLDSSQVLPAAVYGAQQSGVACEILVGIHYMEASWWDDGSFIDGGPISRVYPVETAGLCSAYNGIWIEGSGCKIDTLQDVAYYAANVIKDKMAYHLGYGWRPPANFQEMVGAMSKYNGGGNHNCNNFVPVAYSGPCPAPWYGDDDAYVMTHFDTPHQTMFIFYCHDGVHCAPPYANTRGGTATAAKEYHLRGAGPF